MNPRIAANQQRTFQALFARVRPFVRSDSSLPRRIKELLGQNRALGSRDRRLYRELIYTALRFLPWLEPLFDADPDAAARAVALLAPELPATGAYRAAILDGLTPPPDDSPLAVRAAALGALTGRRHDPADLLPAWLRAECPEAFDPPTLDALNTRARLWLRLQVKDPALVLDECRARGWSWTRPDDVADAVSLPPNADVAKMDAYSRGFCEIQDLGSQLVLHHVPLAGGQRWLDACAGAGGKSLQLAQCVGTDGQVDATDIRPAVLDELQDRAVRGRFANIRILRTPPATAAAYDGVLVDAPCSGSGTWRRLPHMKWYLKPDMLPAFAATQLGILRAQAAHVRPGGVLVYATCSLNRSENHDVVAAFLSGHPEFAAVQARTNLGSRFDGAGHTLLPGVRDTDGFYVAVLSRKAVA